MLLKILRSLRRWWSRTRRDGHNKGGNGCRPEDPKDNRELTPPISALVLRSIPEGMSALSNLTHLYLHGNTGLLYPPYSLVRGFFRNVAEVKEFCGQAEHRREVLWPQIRLLYIGNTDSSCCDTLGCLPVELIWVSAVVNTVVFYLNIWGHRLLRGLFEGTLLCLVLLQGGLTRKRN